MRPSCELQFPPAPLRAPSDGTLRGRSRAHRFNRKRGPGGAFLILALLAVFAAPGWSQEAAPSELHVFGGVSYYNADTAPRRNLWGLQGNVDWNFHRHVGITVDLGGQFNSFSDAGTIQAYEALFGPRFFVRRNKFTGFVNTLAGVTHIRGGRGSGKTFALGFGGGLDVNVSDRVAVRLLKVDYIPARGFGVWTHEVRVGTGVVLKWRVQRE